MKSTTITSTCPNSTIIQDSAIQILDIRSKIFSESEQLNSVVKALSDKEKPFFPVELHYDQRGLELFSAICESPKYYLASSSQEIFKTHAQKVVEQLPEDCALIELGAGDMKKTRMLAQAAHAHKKHLTIFALDLDRVSIQRALESVQKDLTTYITCIGLLGTYDDCIRWLETKPISMPKVILW